MDQVCPLAPGASRVKNPKPAQTLGSRVQTTTNKGDRGLTWRGRKDVYRASMAGCPCHVWARHRPRLRGVLDKVLGEGV
jgi:hypothetical protein